MPELVDHALGAVGESMSDWLDLVPLDPIYRTLLPGRFPTRRPRRVAPMAAEIETVIGPTEADGYRRYVDYLTRLYEVEYDDFIDRNIDRPTDLLTPNLAPTGAMGGFRRLDTKARQYLKDPRTHAGAVVPGDVRGRLPVQGPRASTASSRTWTAWPESPCPRAGCTRSRWPWPERQPNMASTSDMARPSPMSNALIAGHSAVITTDGDRVRADVVVINADLPVALSGPPGPHPSSTSDACRTLHRRSSCSSAPTGTTRPPRITTSTSGRPGAARSTRLIDRERTHVGPESDGHAT